MVVIELPLISSAWVCDYFYVFIIMMIMEFLFSQISGSLNIEMFR